MYSFSYLEPVCCSMSSSNCCFLTCIQISQETDQVVWYSHLFQNFPQFIVIHTVKGFGIVNKAEIDVFLELSCFFPTRDQIRVSCVGSAVLTTGPPEKSPNHLYLYLNCEKPGKHSKSPLYTPKVNYQSFGGTQQSAARLPTGPPLFSQPARGLSTTGFQNPRCYFLL